MVARRSNFRSNVVKENKQKNVPPKFDTLENAKLKNLNDEGTKNSGQKLRPLSQCQKEEELSNSIKVLKESYASVDILTNYTSNHNLKM